MDGVCLSIMWVTSTSLSMYFFLNESRRAPVSDVTFNKRLFRFSGEEV